MDWEMGYEPKRVFKVKDREKLHDYVVNNFFDPGAHWDSWGRNEVPKYIVIVDVSSHVEDVYKGDEAYVEKDKYRQYNTFDIHKNMDVSESFWPNYRLDYLLEKDIIEEFGFFYRLEDLEGLVEDKQGMDKVNLVRTGLEAELDGK